MAYNPSIICMIFAITTAVVVAPKNDLSTATTNFRRIIWEMSA